MRLLRFDAPAPAELLRGALALAPEIDLDLAWTFAPEGEFGFADLARDYFDAKAGALQQAASLIRLFDAPHYFRRVGKGRFKKAPEEIVKAALLAIERKAQLAAQIEAWAGDLVAGQCPAPVREQLYKILFKPDKNAPEYKAVVEAAKRSQRAPLDLLKGAGAITSAYQFHWKRFLFEQFPKGTGFPAGLSAPPVRGRTAACGGPGVFDRRLGHHRDRRCAVRARAGQRHSHLRRPHRRAGPRARTRLAARRRGVATPVDRLHAGLEADHAARRGGRGLHVDRRPRLSGGEPIPVLRRGHARPARPRNQARTRADRRQPAPRPSSTR